MKDIKGSVSSVNEKVIQYIYISSDSVYEVQSDSKKPDFENAIEESYGDSIGYVSDLTKEKYKRLKDIDSYGLRKLEVE